METLDLISAGILIGGAAFSVIGFLWLVLTAFFAGFFWCLAVIFLPGVGILLFVVFDWMRARTPFMLFFIGTLMVVAGGLLAIEADGQVKDTLVMFKKSEIFNWKWRQDLESLAIEKQKHMSSQKKMSDKEKLIMAVQYGQVEMAEELLNTGIDVNTRNMIGNTLLMEASAFGHFEVVQLLLDKGASVYLVSSDGETALSLAKKNNRFQIVRMLIAAGAK